MNQQKPLSRAGFLRQTVHGSGGWLTAAAVGTVLSVVFNFLTPQAIRVTLDSVLGDLPFDLPDFAVKWITSIGGRPYLSQHLIVCAAAAVIFSVLAGASTFFCRVSMAKACEGSLERLRNRLYSHIQRLPYRWHISVQTGDIIQRCTSDTEVIHNFLANQILEIFRTVVLVVTAIAWMFTMSSYLTWVSIAFLPVVMAYSGIFFSLISRRFRTADEAEGALSTAVQENLTGVRVVRAFGREAYEMKNFDEKNERFSSLWVKLGKLLGPYWGIGDGVTALQIMTIVLLGVHEAVAGRLTLGQFTVFVSYNSMMAWPVRNLGRILGEMGKMSVSIDRLREILNAEEESDDPQGLTPDMSGDIKFEHVSFGYGDSPDLLHDVSFTVPAGKTLGILGSTGSGKSTLTYLLARLYDVPEGKGRITVGGVDLRKMRLSHVRKNVGLVLQEPFLFSRTLRENIAATRGDRPIEEVRAVARIAAVDDAIEEFPDGYDTIVGERGVTLSGGQKQRVAIARMLMEHTPIKIFDDSLSAVDAETDAKIRASLKSGTAGSTVILISHRVSTIKDADLIVVLENGRVVQQGTHEELAAQDGIYRRVWQIQNCTDDELPEISPKGADPLGV
jgi:ATP-binding cassette subfamily B protein